MNAKQAEVTALVLAGGRGSRMGGADKGWVPLNGVPLVSHLLARLVPQVSGVVINANRNLERYRRLGWPVVHDANPTAYDGPLAGMLAGLRNCDTEWLLTVPCDSPFVPKNYAFSMVQAAQGAKVPIAMASDGRRHQPVFCLIRRDLAASLQAFLDAGDRKIDIWTRSHGAIEVVFDDANAFKNFNTAAELHANDLE
ncbi:MAG: molybdenum cofactor guanylyltransferase MobA [Pseudomonadota bacterium]